MMIDCLTEDTSSWWCVV